MHPMRPRHLVPAIANDTWCPLDAANIHACQEQQVVPMCFVVIDLGQELLEPMPRVSVLLIVGVGVWVHVCQPAGGGRRA